MALSGRRWAADQCQLSAVKPTSQFDAAMSANDPERKSHSTAFVAPFGYRAIPRLSGARHNTPNPEAASRAWTHQTIPIEQFYADSPSPANHGQHACYNDGQGKQRA